jgi:Carboxypeptidase regulatory-like domain
MRHILTVALGLSVALQPLSAVAASPQSGGTINGTAENSAGDTLPNYTVQLRSVQTGKLVGSTTSNAAGNFSFTGLDADTYLVEVVSPAGDIVGTSAALTLGQNATITVAVMQSAATALAGTAGAATGTAVSSGSGLSGMALTLTALAAAGGVTAVVVSGSRSEASPSR